MLSHNYTFNLMNQSDGSDDLLVQKCVTPAVVLHNRYSMKAAYSGKVNEGTVIPYRCKGKRYPFRCTNLSRFGLKADGSRPSSRIIGHCSHSRHEIDHRETAYSRLLCLETFYMINQNSSPRLYCSFALRRQTFNIETIM